MQIKMPSGPLPEGIFCAIAYAVTPELTVWVRRYSTQAV